jgi:hypothetical protein
MKDGAIYTVLRVVSNREPDLLASSRFASRLIVPVLLHVLRCFWCAFPDASSFRVHPKHSGLGHYFGGGGIDGIHCVQVGKFAQFKSFNFVFILSITSKYHFIKFINGIT